MEIGSLINKLADSVSANHGFATILDNPIYTALIMTFVVMIIFYFAGAYDKSSSRLRMTFYVFVSLLAIIFIYHRRFRKCQSEQTKMSEIQSALANPLPMSSTERVPIIPPTYLA